MTARLEEAVAHWRAAENRLYPVVMTRPDLYEQSVRLVRAVADKLRSARDPDALLEAYARAADVVTETVRQLDLSTEGVDMGLIAGAAFSLRYRELLEEMNRDEAMRRIREGRERGAEWVVVYETEQRMPPYRRLEMQLSSGTGLHVFVEMNPDTGRPLFGVETVQLDPQTGDWVREARMPAERQTFADAETWEQAVRALREQRTSSA